MNPTENLIALLTNAGLLNPPLDLGNGEWAMDSSTPGINGSVPQYLDPNAPRFTGVMPVDPSLKAKRDADRQKLIDLVMRQPQQSPLPRPTQPAFRTQDAILGLGIPALMALLGGKKGAQAIPDFMSGYLGGKQNKAQQDTQFNFQNWEQGNRQDAATRNAQLKAAELQSNFSEGDYNEAIGERSRQEALADRDKGRLESAAYRYTTAYEKAKGLNGMKSVAKAWAEAERRAGLPITAPSEEQVESDFIVRAGAARDDVYMRWNQTLKPILDANYGMVPEAAMAGLAPFERQLQKELQAFGITDATLPQPPTEMSIKGQEKAQYLKIAQDKYKLDEKRINNAILDSKARVKILQGQLNVAQQRASFYGSNAEVYRLNYLLRKAQGGVNKEIQKELDSIGKKIGDLRVAQMGAGNQAKRLYFEAQIQYWVRQQQYYRELGETEIPEMGFPGEQPDSMPEPTETPVATGETRNLGIPGLKVTKTK